MSFPFLLLKVESAGENAISIQIDKEDYSIADIVHKELLSVKHVRFTGVPPPHPLVKTLTIQVQTDGANPSKALQEAIDISLEKISELLEAARQAFPPTEVRKETPSSPTSEAVVSEQST